jgi:thiol-disulfide isomerase/thioredoxin
MKSIVLRQSISAALPLAVCIFAQVAVGDPPTAPPECDSTGTEDFLTVGDRAPALDAAHWLRGAEINYLEPDRIYVLTFWSTWCKYCHASFATLSHLQAEHEDQGVVVAGISDEKLQTVFEFMVRPEWNQQVTFSIATDPDLSVQREYMEAAAIGDIPTTFLVGRDGLIEWIGHPRKLEGPLQAVIEGRWDREAFKMQFEERMAPARARYARMREMKRAYDLKDWDGLLALFDEAIESDERPAPLKLQRFLLMIGDMKLGSEGYAYGRTLLREFWDDASSLNQIAWVVVDHETVEVRDLDFAMKAAERAASLTDHQDAAILDTLARVHFENGDVASALDWQRKAVEYLDPEDPLAPVIRAALTKYEEESQAAARESRGGGR